MWSTRVISRTVLSLAAVVALSACGETPETLASTEASSASEQGQPASQTAIPILLDEGDPDAVSGEPVPVDPAVDENPEVVDDPVEDEPEPIELCDNPPKNGDLFFVDVAIDDPDGGLNLRDGAGARNNIIGVFPRSSDLITTGECTPVGSVDWWQVVPNTNSSEDGIGWVSSKYLSTTPVFNPGLGKAIQDDENVGISGETLDELAENLAVAYGFDEDVVITVAEEPEAGDAQGGKVSYNLSGLKDDASSGYLVEIDFLFDKNEEEDGQIEGYTAIRIINYANCTRGVSEDGLCM